MTRKIDIEALCADKGLRITEQRKTIARVLGESEDHPDVETLHARAVARVVGALALFVVVAPIHVLTKALLGRSPWPRRFLAGVAWIFGARVRIDGAPLRAHSLVVANHLSWFDIVVLGGSTGCSF